MGLRIVNQDSHPAEVSVDLLRDCRVAVIGFGNQGAAHALNLRDSGIDIAVANRRDSPNGQRAIEEGFDLRSIADAVRDTDLVIIALPDEVQPEVYRDRIEPNLKPGAVIGFLHGFAIHHGFVQPREDVGVVLVAPKGPGVTLRRLYVEDRGLPCLFAAHQDSSVLDAERIGLAWAAGIGCGRSAIIYTTFADETVTDLFGEQAVLCGGMTGLVVAAFEILVQHGYPPELAYLECCHEIKQVADLLYARGLSGMNQAISNTAEFGAFRAAPVLIDKDVRTKMERLLREIVDGTFARAMREDTLAGSAWIDAQRRALADHPIGEAGKAIRALMPWLGSDSDE